MKQKIVDVVRPVSGVNCCGGSSAVGGGSPCAIDHSLAAVIALVIMAGGGVVLLSKIKRFLAVQIAQTIQGKRLIETPTGGRLTRWRDICSSTPKEEIISESRVDVQGARAHTCLAKSQWKNMWVVVSIDPHLMQLVLMSIPHLWRFSPVGMALRRIFHKKSWIFGSVWVLHTDLNQLKSSGRLKYRSVDSFSCNAK